MNEQDNNEFLRLLNETMEMGVMVTDAEDKFKVISDAMILQVELLYHELDDIDGVTTEDLHNQIADVMYEIVDSPESAINFIVGLATSKAQHDFLDSHPEFNTGRDN